MSNRNYCIEWSHADQCLKGFFRGERKHKKSWGWIDGKTIYSLDNHVTFQRSNKTIQYKLRKQHQDAREEKISFAETMAAWAKLFPKGDEEVNQNYIKICPVFEHENSNAVKLQRLLGGKLIICIVRIQKIKD